MKVGMPRSGLGLQPVISARLASIIRSALPGSSYNGLEPNMSTMTHRGYSARIEYDDDGVFTGRVAGFRDGVGFHADNVADLREAFHEAVEDYIETCAKAGKQPQRAFSGQVMFRVRPEVHGKAAVAAELAGKSLNQWAEEALDRAASDLHG